MNQFYVIKVKTSHFWTTFYRPLSHTHTHTYKQWVRVTQIEWMQIFFHHQSVCKLRQHFYARYIVFCCYSVHFRLLDVFFSCIFFSLLQTSSYFFSNDIFINAWCAWITMNVTNIYQQQRLAYNNRHNNHPHSTQSRSCTCNNT